jgi:Flp pilus assembly protein TadG
MDILKGLTKLMNTRTHQRERGQFLVLLVVMLIGLLAMLALVLDGGNVYAKRRSAQNAADAGALAGARALCLTKDPNQAQFMARQYAEVYNGPMASTVSVATQVVTVTTQITFDSFFAHLIGLPTLQAEATAAAGCFNPTTGQSVLPVAWACRPPIHGLPSSSEDCQEKAITQDQLKYYLQNPPPPGTIYPELYIIMDSVSLPGDLTEVCMSNGGYMQCDLNGDGIDDLQANGDRSWLDLDGGGGGASELISWVQNGFPGEVVEHTWIGGQSGVENSVFQAVGDMVGKIFAVPVFNYYCDNYPTPSCASHVHPSDVIIDSSGGNYYYHVIAFAAFYVTCVNAPGVPGPECPGHKVAADVAGLKANTKTIEGYFVDGILPNLGGGSPGGGFDTGAYVLKLIR